MPMPRLLSMLFALASLAACVPPDHVRADAPNAPRRSAHGSSVVQGGTPPLVVASTRPVVEVDPQRALGSASATIAIVEFADYQCPYCRRFHLTTFSKLRQEYVETGKVRYFYKDFPLSSHAHAFSAAVAAHCAGAQGRYWQMQDLLYSEQARLGREGYVALGTKLGLELPRFESCLTSRAAEQAVRRDLMAGRRLGVRATPTFVLGRVEGGRVVVERIAAGTLPFEVFAQEIELMER